MAKQLNDKIIETYTKARLAEDFNESTISEIIGLLKKATIIQSIGLLDLEIQKAMNMFVSKKQMYDAWKKATAHLDKTVRTEIFKDPQKSVIEKRAYKRNGTTLKTAISSVVSSHFSEISIDKRVERVLLKFSSNYNFGTILTAKKLLVKKDANGAKSNGFDLKLEAKNVLTQFLTKSEISSAIDKLVSEQYHDSPQRHLKIATIVKNQKRMLAQNKKIASGSIDSFILQKEVLLQVNREIKKAMGFQNTKDGVEKMMQALGITANSDSVMKELEILAKRRFGPNARAEDASPAMVKDVSEAFVKEGNAVVVDRKKFEAISGEFVVGEQNVSVGKKNIAKNMSKASAKTQKLEPLTQEQKEKQEKQEFWKEQGKTFNKATLKIMKQTAKDSGENYQAVASDCAVSYLSKADIKQIKGRIAKDLNAVFNSAVVQAIMSSEGFVSFKDGAMTSDVEILAYVQQEKAKYVTKMQIHMLIEQNVEQLVRKETLVDTVLLVKAVFKQTECRNGLLNKAYLSEKEFLQDLKTVVHLIALKIQEEKEEKEREKMLAIERGNENNNNREVNELTIQPQIQRSKYDQY